MANAAFLLAMGALLLWLWHNGKWGNIMQAIQGKP